MPTRSTIAVQHADGSVSSSYCHFDGYLDSNGQMLVSHYNTLEKAEALVALGAMSLLEESIDKPEGHTFDNPTKKHTVFYGRDRGETGQCVEAQKFKDVDEYNQKNENEEYNYLFRNDKWECESYGEHFDDVAKELERMRQEERRKKKTKLA